MAKTLTVEGERLRDNLALIMRLRFVNDRQLATKIGMNRRSVQKGDYLLDTPALVRA